ncbi:MAG: carboxypeptidase-like regulatory domain-containing protein [Acidobacteriia bacterium]|nr:carboxypeptidase-like regulatory domain-containing protein [Terriglobia bacterium]
MPTQVQQPVVQPTVSQLTGLVMDTANRSVAGAGVEVLSGPQAGTSTTSDSAGKFSLTGIFDGTTRFRVSKEGYAAATQAINVAPAYGVSILFVMEALAAPVNIAGDYTLTFIADSACADQLPSEMRTRTYPATIVPQHPLNRPGNTRFAAMLSGPSFDSYYHMMSIAVAGDYLSFDLSDNYLLEEVADEAYFAIGGVGGGSAGTSGASTISASFQGTFDYCVMKSELEDGSHYNCTPDVAVVHAQCAAKNHRLILTRR